MYRKIQIEFDYGEIDIYRSWIMTLFTVIELNLYLMVQSIVLKFEKIWLSHTLNIIRKPKKFLFSKRKRAITHER
jgi:hypothetical protein